MKAISLEEFAGGLLVQPVDGLDHLLFGPTTLPCNFQQVDCGQAKVSQGESFASGRRQCVEGCPCFAGSSGMTATDHWTVLHLPSSRL